MTRCPACSECARVTPVGFASVPYLRCTRFGMDVDGSDGCTFGTEGEPQVGVEGCETYLSAHPSERREG